MSFLSLVLLIAALVLVVIHLRKLANFDALGIAVLLVVIDLLIPAINSLR
jgi:hypothetical protein